LFPSPSPSAIGGSKDDQQAVIMSSKVNQMLASKLHDANKTFSLGTGSLFELATTLVDYHLTIAELYEECVD
jgi:hypothetical protein